jgi:NAD(P)-dependent dehydrogenase (short-subunit alcohol dehydrogenase family)
MKSDLNNERLCDLTGTVAIVTGGAQGLGFGSATWLSRAGAQVAILDRNAEGAKDAVKKLHGHGHISVPCDITNAKDREQAIAAVYREFGSIDTLVNNAGITYITPAEYMDEEGWRSVFEVNIHGMMFMSRDVSHFMFKRSRGSIINIGSITSLLAMPGRAAYVTTKTAVLGLTRVLASEWAARGVRVNAIGPGYHKTALLEEYIDSGLVEEDKIRRRIPAGRLGTVDDIGKAAVFFASSLSEYVTGQFLMIDGGYTTFGAPGDAS